jgi:hypothetical protein
MDRKTCRAIDDDNALKWKVCECGDMQTWGKGFADGQGYVVIGQKWLEPNLCSLPKCSRLCCPWSEVVRAKGNYSLVCGPKYLHLQGGWKRQGGGP